MICERSITFIIPGIEGAPDVEVKVVENEGALEFTVTVLETDGVVADLRGLFFNVNDDLKLAGLLATGDDVTDQDTGDVIDLGKGANMRGVAAPFASGIEFGGPGIGKNKGDIQQTSFTLTNDAGDLTLDDIANVEFGARLTSVGELDGPRNGSAKLTIIAPAAPDAVDDSYNIFEDSAAGLDDPRDTSSGTVFQVLANDTDADGDTLTITHVFGAEHGTVEIVDGDDADLLPGDAILYTPTTDYAGTDAFTYCISDNNGGTDFAMVAVAIEAVADIPDVSIEAAATGNVNEILLTVTATQTDDDNSEFIDRILSSALPAGVTLTPSGPVDPAPQPAGIVQQYLLTLPLDTDQDFELTFTAVSKEVSNGDTETGSASIDIVYEYNEIASAMQFEANDQSIWSQGDEFVFDNTTFLGLDTGPFNETLNAGPFEAGISGDIRIGLESTLHFEGGDIDATAEYDVTVETNYNKTVDELLIQTSSILTDTFFTTMGPSGFYQLDFVWDILIDAFAGVDIDLGGIDLDPAGIIPGDQTIDFGSIDETINFPSIDIGPGSFNILDLQSSDAGGTIPFPAPADFLSVDWAWPNISTTSNPAPLNPAVSEGASNNFLQLNVDLDELVTTVAGLPINPFNPRLEAGPFFAELDVLNVFVNAGLNFLQEFEMAMGDLVGLLSFEDGTFTSFTIGESLQISDASFIDLGGDGDGLVEFDFNVIPESELSNLTSLGFNVGGGVDLLSAEAGYDLTINNPFSAVVGPDEFGFSDSVGFGPLAGFELSFPVADIEVFKDTFDLAFEQEQFTAFA
ncbi:Ig-like domain-containing protein [Roseovarius aestuariivivens]|uniref:Ig-like domain-containing protein n=1 Tax=Roseovarius aestuariivivens TaxID=1888910 RepID=UPI001081E611|nr:Ig-like domain-containing protein [Roseovarius aestuariivivens]